MKGVGRPRVTARQTRDALATYNDETLAYHAARPVADGSRGAPVYRAVLAEVERRHQDLEAWLRLADELNDGDAYDERDWTRSEVNAAQRAADRYALPFPPAIGDYDRASTGDYGQPVQRVRYSR